MSKKHQANVVKPKAVRAKPPQQAAQAQRDDHIAEEIRLRRLDRDQPTEVELTIVKPKPSVLSRIGDFFLGPKS